MNVLITGNRGYIGSVLVAELAQRGHRVIGFDTDYYRDCELAPRREFEFLQITKDARDSTPDDLNGVDCVIHLAALSNDPLGELNSSLTIDINFNGTLRVARAAQTAGVKRFVYVSSQSMYGISSTDDELDEDTSEKNPLTMYAKTKWDSEVELKAMASDAFEVVCFRPSTVFGVSPRLRCDIVFNNLVACAYTTGKIEIKSDGTPWRPVVHVQDVCRALCSGLEAPSHLVNGESFNVGILNGNYTVRELAEAAQRSVPGSTLVFTGEHGPDSRTYKVSFKKIFTVLKNYYSPIWNLDSGARELCDFFRSHNLTEARFRGRSCVRLQQINFLMSQGLLTHDLRWTASSYA